MLMLNDPQNQHAMRSVPPLYRIQKTRNAPPRTPTTHITNPLLTTRPLAARPGNAFATVAVPPAVTTEQLAVPQLYPDGQHPGKGPASLPHKNQPLAHDPVVVAGTPLAGTTIVRPFVLTMVVIAMGGQLVVWQSRPVWQQPPPAEARQG